MKRPFFCYLALPALLFTLPTWAVDTDGDGIDDAVDPNPLVMENYPALLTYNETPYPYIDHYLGYSVSGAGDVNNDGYDDLVAASIGEYAGAASFANVIDGKTGNTLYSFPGSAFAHSGYSVSGAGDVNADGYADVIIASPAEGGELDEGPGAVRVYSGVNGQILYIFSGNGAYDYFGGSVSDAGDINNDGYADIIVGIPGNDNDGAESGSVQVFSGIDGSILYTFNGDSAGDQLGRSVSSVGDINKDGYADLVVGVPGDDHNGNASGSARIFSGVDGAILYTFYGDSVGDLFGSSVSGAGDVNGDTYADLVVGTYYDDSNGVDAGSAQIFSGVDGSILYTLYGDSAGDHFGISVSGAGDVNQDGYADVIVGASQDNTAPYAGSARVFNGIDGSVLYAFNGDGASDRFGWAVSDAGDINNDGYPDLVVGAPFVYDSDVMMYMGVIKVFSGAMFLQRTTDTDNDGLVNTLDTDDDNDGVVDLTDAFPLDITEWLDTDGDGTGNNADLDDDGDGLSDINDNCPLYASQDITNTDHDALGDVCDEDDDNDGYPDINDALPLDATENVDTDVDGIGNNADTDDDDDGLLDELDNCPLIRNINQLNFDGDLLGDICDEDDDNDNVLDELDDLPFNPLEWLDTDHDGIGNNSDTDDDSDGIPDSFDLNPLVAESYSATVYSGTQDYENFGKSVSNAGDVNQDGYPDIVIGRNSSSSGSTDKGAAIILSGNTGSVLYSFVGDSVGDNFGSSVSGAGDVNNDGYADIIVGAYGDDNNGFSSGSARVFSGANGSILYTFSGDSASDEFGRSVSGAGDVNGDGYADVIVGAHQDDNNGSNSGSARVFSGVNGSILYTFNGDGADDRLGRSVSGAGDVNGDGYADIVVGAYLDDNNYKSDSGSARVFSGRNGVILYTFNGDSAGDYFGWSVSDADDVNNDGYADVIVGAIYDDNNGKTSSGSARVLSGKTGAVLYVFNGNDSSDQFGSSVSSAGDVNADGYSDLIIGAGFDDNNGKTDSGSARVVSGKTGSILYTFNGGDVDDRLGTSVSSVGDVDGDGYSDLLVGAFGDDDNGKINSGSLYLFSGDLNFDYWDTDGDGFLDNVDNCRLVSDGSQINTDGDLQGDACDTDDDNDDVADILDKFPLNVAASVDDDNDGFPEAWNATCSAVCQLMSGLVLDNCPSTSNVTQTDFDEDNQGDACDSDDDNDGITDVSDKFPLNVAASSDIDNDGFPGSWNAACDVTCQQASGLVLDNCPSNANVDQLNTDGDAQGDVCDADDDNDGVSDISDAFPLDATEWLDTDGDGVGNNADWDDDNDGVPDTVDFAPLNAGDTSEIILPVDGIYKGSALKAGQIAQ